MLIDILSLRNKEIKEIDMVWNGFRAGTVGALISPGGTGKSYWALEAAMAVACPAADLLNICPPHSGRVLYFAVEDDRDEIEYRMQHMIRDLPQEVVETVAENMYIDVKYGERMDILRESHLDAILEWCADIEPRLIVFDTLSRIHTASENSNEEMAHLISTFEYITRQTHAAVIFVHHTSKFAALNGQVDAQQSARGASALIDNVRYCAYLQSMTPEEARKWCDCHGEPIGEENRKKYVRFGVSKLNHGETPPHVWYRRSLGGVLVPVELHESSKVGVCDV
jgi:hypothetical protein